MGFSIKWCKWIIGCLSSASISVLINGSPSKEFPMEKGLRQGDPLSPFLFLIVGEALQTLTLEACNKRIFKGICLADGSNLSLLQFADDALFFGHWSIENALNLIKILNCFNDASGLKINLSKSCLYGIGVENEDIVRVAREIECQHDSLPFMYLGLPVGRKMNRISSWESIIEKVKKRLSSWKGRLLSIGGRLTLINSVLGSLPLYYFSLFQAPSKVVKEIESIRSRFLWGIKDDEKGITWVSWNQILQNKDKKGLGVGSLKAKNMALIGKWKWRYVSEEQAL